MEKRRNSRTSNLKSATTKAKATVKSTVEKIEKTPAAEKTVKAVKKATETVAAKAPEVVEEVKNTVKNHKISGITLEIFETSITVADLEAAVKKDAEAKGLKGKELHIYVKQLTTLLTEKVPTITGSIWPLCKLRRICSAIAYYAGLSVTFRKRKKPCTGHFHPVPLHDFSFLSFTGSF